MKETGINYFYNNLELETGNWGIFYTFEEAAGTNIASISGAQSLYSGTLNSETNFWTKPGSGFFSGTQLTVNNTSGLQSETWTKIFVFEKVNTNEAILFNSLNNNSGHKIGITPTNKLYFESYNQQPIIATSTNNYSSKNAVSVSYLTNYVTFGYYNFNSKEMESESFDYPFEVAQSNSWVIGGQFTGYLDYFLHFTQYQSPSVIGQLLSGLWAYPTGTSYPVVTNCVTGITGYQDIFVGLTGVTGYSVSPGGDEGRDYYTGAFPTFHTETASTGYISSGMYSSGVSGVNCYPITGTTPTTLFLNLTGYASSFGMEKIQLFTPIDTGDITKASYSFAPFEHIYNKIGQRSYSGYLLEDSYTTGQINLFYNGVGQANSGWSMTGDYLIITGATAGDIATFDLKVGNKQMFDVTGGLTGFSFNYSGQEIFLNGVNLVSGYDYILDAGTLNLTSRATGISGYIFEYPIVLAFNTGSFSMQTGSKFWRNTSNVYLNGVRQQKDSLYIEGATFDLLSGNSFSYNDVINVYNNSDLFWDIS